jgi:predicted nucleotide-binding protein
VVSPPRARSARSRCLACLRHQLLPEPFPTSASGSPWGGGEVGNGAGRPPKGVFAGRQDNGPAPQGAQWPHAARGACVAGVRSQVTVVRRRKGLPSRFLRVVGRVIRAIGFLGPDPAFVTSSDLYLAWKMTRLAVAGSINAIEVGPREQVATPATRMFLMADDIQAEADFVFLAVSLGDARSEARLRADSLLDVVERVVRHFSLSVRRADKIVAPGLITSQVIASLANARFIIADISDANPNVMYELGVAHSLQKPVIILSEKHNRLPFDLAVTRIIIYDLSVQGMGSLEGRLTETVDYLMTAETSSSVGISPVQVALDASRDRSHEPPIGDGGKADSNESVLAMLGDIRERMASIERRISDLDDRRSTKEGEPISPYSRKIFIVHGHDDGLRLELRNFLSQLDFQPIILHERADSGQTLYSKLLGEASDVGYAFILLTPDDKGGRAASDTLMPRARQNVVFEHGLFTGYLSPNRVCAIIRGSVEIPSDLNGVVYKQVPDGGSINSIAFDIARELRAAGYIVDMNKLS